MSSQYLQSTTPNEDINLKVNDITVEDALINGNVLIGGTVVLNSDTTINGQLMVTNNIDSSMVVSAKSFSQDGAYVPAQQVGLLTNPIDCTGAVAGQRLFYLQTISTTLAAGSAELFSVNLAPGVVTLFSQVIVSCYDYSNTYSGGGTPFVYVGSVDPSVNRVQLVVKNLANGQPLDGVLSITMTIIGGANT